MKSPFRLIGRIIFLLVVLVFLVAGGILAWFTSWRADRISDLDAESELVETSLGTVELVVRGEGPAVLVLHDAPGGYDQALLLGSGLEAAGFQVIAPSRPGYLRTPLKSGLLPRQQGDLMVALLDKLGVQKAAIIAMGSSGQSALDLVQRFPSRVSALVLLSAATYKIDSSQFPADSTQIGTIITHKLTGDVGSWIALDVAERRPADLAKPFVDWTSMAEGTQSNILTRAIVFDPANLEWFQTLFQTYAPLSPRESGVRNDTLNDLAAPSLADSTPAFQRISVPTLLVHGTLDRNVPFVQAQEGAKAIPGAQLLPVEGAGHFVYLSPGAPDVRRKIEAFLKTPVAPPPAP